VPLPRQPTNALQANGVLKSVDAPHSDKGLFVAGRGPRFWLVVVLGNVWQRSSGKAWRRAAN